MNNKLLLSIELKMNSLTIGSEEWWRLFEEHEEIIHKQNKL